MKPNFSYIDQAHLSTPDWTEYWTEEQIKEQLDGIEFSGPGWYIYESSQTLIIPTPGFDPDATEQLYKVCEFGCHVGEAFNQIANAPVRVDRRKV